MRQQKDNNQQALIPVDAEHKPLPIHAAVLIVKSTGESAQTKPEPEVSTTTDDRRKHLKSFDPKCMLS